jgi:predicted nucleotidyltransferase component of viral defense system
MIHEDSLKEKWITGVAKQHKSDPILIEKVARALYLLEHLQNSGLEFIFKGGTALMLLLKEPKRFSIDIDIIISNKPENMKRFLDVVLKSSDFLKYKMDERQSKSNIEKEHYKFYYTPVTNARAEQEYILLDVLYEESHYGTYTDGIEIKSPFIKSAGENVKVTVPIPEAILGDKLTAFAPNTTGVPYGREKEVEIIKQLFDVGHLFDIITDMTIVSEVFTQFAKTELEYRELSELKEVDVLNDVFQTALLMGTRGKSGIGDYNELQRGVQNIKNYIFSENFHLERAMVPAAKAAYIATMLQTGVKKIAHFTNPMEVKDWTLEQPFETRLNKLKKSNPEAFFYWYKILELKV